jgi:hypothetical protein
MGVCAPFRFPPCLCFVLFGRPTTPVPRTHPHPSPPHRHRPHARHFTDNCRLPMARAPSPTIGQLDAAFDFLSHLEPGAPLSEAAFNAACGVGVEVSRAEIEAAVAVEADNNKAVLLEERYLFNVSALQVCGGLLGGGGWGLGGWAWACSQVVHAHCFPATRGGCPS